MITFEHEEIMTSVVPLRHEGDAQTGVIHMIDQRKLPIKEHWYTYSTAEEIAASIKDMVIRGAPAIGIAAAFGIVFGVRAMDHTHDAQAMERLCAMFASTRPTAVNLFWALEHMSALHKNLEGQPKEHVIEKLYEKAILIMAQDRANNLNMGKLGAHLLSHGTRILTHCNTGGLATGGYGTALGVIRSAHADGKIERVFVDETRPYLQGARLTAWECLKDKIPATLITDNMAGHFMQQGRVDAVIVGSDRIGLHGHVANKIGTYTLAVLCKHHNIPFYVAAPRSTFDVTITQGDQIFIEQRSAHEVTHIRAQPIAPKGVDVAHPAFDITPPELVTAIICEEGVAHAPYAPHIRSWLSK